MENLEKTLGPDGWLIFGSTGQAGWSEFKNMAFSFMTWCKPDDAHNIYYTAHLIVVALMLYVVLISIFTFLGLINKNITLNDWALANKFTANRCLSYMIRSRMVILEKWKKPKLGSDASLNLNTLAVGKS